MSKEAIVDDGMSVVCDHCTFERKVEHINQFLNKTCPECDSEDILVTDNDIETYNAMMSLVGIVNEVVGEVDDDSDRVHASMKITDGQVKKVTIEEV